MEKVFEKNFTVLPVHTNYHPPMIFGGHFLAELDLCAANCVTRALRYSQSCDSAVTHVVETKFLKPCYVGDIIFMRAEIVDLGEKSVVVTVTADREKRQTTKRDRVGEAKFVFVTISHVEDVANCPDKLPYAPHGLVLDETQGHPA